MSFTELPPSKQWATLKYREEKLAEVWIKPEGDPFALTFRIPQESFHIPEMGQRLTLENLLKAVSVAPEDVDSWRYGTDPQSGVIGSELGDPLQPPPQGHSHLIIQVSLKQPTVDVASPENSKPEIPSAKWQDIEARWKTILGLEVAMDGLRQRMEGLLAEMEASMSRSLTSEEKVNALNADVAQWNKAKSRVHYSIPKAKEFIHRATWSLALPERKRLEEFFKNQNHQELLRIEKLPELLENLQKDRQILSGQGTAVYQECKGVLTMIQGALRTLQMNSASNAQKKRGAASSKNKSF